MGLRRSFCGCSLKTGSLVIGYVYLVLSAIGIVMSGLSVLVLVLQGQEGSNSIDSMELALQPPSKTYVEIVLTRIYLVTAVVCVKSLIVSSLMIHGIRHNQPALVLPWILFLAAGMVVQSSVTFYTALSRGPLGTIGIWLAVCGGLILGFCFEMYILLVVTSHYHHMKKSSLLDEEEIMM